MSESELDDALNDIDLSELEEGGGDAPAADAGGGDDVQLDADLEAALAESGEGDAPAAEGGGEDMDIGADLEAALADAGEGDAGESSGAGEDMDFGDDLEAALASVDVDDAGSVAGAGGDADMGDLGSLADALGGGGAPAPAAGGVPSGALAGLDQDDPNVEFLLEIKLHVTFEVGRAKMLISDLLTLGQGSVVELHRLVGDELDLLVNGKLLAKGEVVVVNERFGCRVSAIVPPEDRIKYLGGV